MPDLSWRVALQENARAYRLASPTDRKRMACRALRFAALTIHTPWVTSFRLWQDGKEPKLPTARTFYRRRKHLLPEEWCSVSRETVKSHFARALLGFDDAACYDVWITRRFPHLVGKQWHGSTFFQWEQWFQIYSNVYPHMRGQVVPQHVAVLLWVRTGRRPKPIQTSLWRKKELRQRRKDHE